MGKEKGSDPEKIAVFLTIYEELNTSESESESVESSFENPRDGVDRIIFECGEHDRLARLGQKTDRRISVRNGERKVSVKNVKVMEPYYQVHFEKILQFMLPLFFSLKIKELHPSKWNRGNKFGYISPLAIVISSSSFPISYKYF